MQKNTLLLVSVAIIIVLPIILFLTNNFIDMGKPDLNNVNPEGTLKTRTIKYYPTLQKDYPVVSGSCFTSSWALSGRGDAFKCIADNDHIIRDPCFAMGDRVICDENPMRDGDEVEIELTSPLPQNEDYGTNIWTILLSDGSVCQFDESNGEKMIGDDYINHYCSPSKVLTENFETSGDFVVWEVGQLSDDVPRRIVSREMVPVLKIWE